MSHKVSPSLTVYLWATLDGPPPSQGGSGAANRPGAGRASTGRASRARTGTPATGEPATGGPIAGTGGSNPDASGSTWTGPFRWAAPNGPLHTGEADAVLN